MDFVNLGFGLRLSKRLLISICLFFFLILTVGPVQSRPTDLDELIAPDVTCPDPIVGLTCGDTLPAPATDIYEFLDLAGADVTDDCNDIWKIMVNSVDDVDPATFTFCAEDAPFVVTRTYLLTNDCEFGQTSVCQQTFTWDIDTDPLIIICPDSIQGLTCTDLMPQPVTSVAEFLLLPGADISGSCASPDLLTISSFDDVDPTAFTLCAADTPFVMTRTYVITDACGTDSDSCTQVFTWVADTIAPVVTCPIDITIDCAVLPDTMLTGMATAMDNCEPGPPCTMSSLSAPVTELMCFGPGTEYQQTFTACDDGIIEAVSVDISYVDTPGDIIIGLSNGSQTIATNTSSFFAAHKELSMIELDIPFQVYANSIYTLTIVVPPDVDACINQSSTDYAGGSAWVNGFALFPDFSFSIDVNTGGLADPAVVTFIDSTAVGSCAQELIITRTWVASDACGNSSSCQQLITMVDSEAPVVAAPNPVAGLTCSDALPAAATTIAEYLTLAGAAVTDNCATGDDFVVTSSDDVDPSTFSFCNADAPFEVTRTYFISDSCGNAALPVQQIFSWDADTTPPNVSAPNAVMGLDCNDGLPAAVTNITEYLALPGASATDNCTATANLTIQSVVDVDPNSFSFCNTDAPFVVTRTYTILDACGNSAAVQQTFTWTEDVTPPVISCPDPVMGLNCSDALPTAATTVAEFLLLPGAAAMDNCSSAAEMTITVVDDVDPTTVALCAVSGPNVVTRTYTIFDACGNASSSCTQTFTWNPDAVLPTVICQDITVELGANGTANITASMLDNGSTDNCGSVSLMADVTTVGCSDIGNPVSANLTATDVCENMASCTSTITVVDLLPPVLDCPGDITLTLASGACSIIYNYNVSATDNCDSNAQLNLVNGLPSGSDLLLDTPYSFSYMAEDIYGNQSNCSWTVTVEENPVQSTQINCLSSQTVALDLNCMGEITPDMLLTGNNYGCFDNFTVNLLFDVDLTLPVLTSPFVNADHVGLTLYASVVSENGNSCTGVVMIEDYLIPDLLCGTYEVPCFESTAPGGIAAFPVPDSAIVFQTASQQGSQQYTVSNFDACSDDALLSYVETSTDFDCVAANPYAETIFRSWTFDDNNGNSTTCTDTIHVLNATLAQVVVPPNYDGLDLPMLLCDEKEVESTSACGATIGWNAIDEGDFNFPVVVGHPSPADELYACGQVKWSGTGFPSVGATCGNIGYTFSDLRINVCSVGSSDGCYELLRKWTILDWCTGELIEVTQLIKVGDDQGPTISDLSDATVSTDPWTCSATYYVPDPWIEDNCSELDGDYAITASAGTVAWVPALQRFVITEIPLGIHTYTITAADCCGNETSQSYTLTIEDQVPPVVVVDQQHAVSLTSDGSGKVFANTFDEGSYDACGPVWLKVIRVPDLLNTVSGSNTSQTATTADFLNGDDNAGLFGNQIYFDDFVKFDCADIGNTDLVVQLRVFDVDPGEGPVDPARMLAGGDLFGHFNDGHSTITVEDYLPPFIVAPSDITVSCEYDFDSNTLDDVNNALFGIVVTSDQNGDGLLNYLDRDSIFITDRACPGDANYNPQQPLLQYTVGQGIDGIAGDNCGVVISISVVENLSCGQGSITRIFTATDPDGRTSNAIQTITIEDCDPFYINDTTCNNFDALDGVHWPCDVNSNSCGAATDPSATGSPLIYNDDNCALISVTSDDEEFPVVADACFTIKRIWTVTDWCQLDITDTDNNDVYDPTDDGVILGQWEYVQFIHVLNTVAPTFSNCSDLNFCGYNSDCTGSVSLTQSISDDCTPEALLLIDFKIDAFNDGSYDYLGSNQGVYPFPNPGLPLLAVSYSDNGDGSYEMTIGAVDYPVGTHRILWTAEDMCSNVSTCQYLFTVEDCKLPTAKAFNGLAVDIMPATQTIELSADWFDNGSFDNCGLAQLLVVSPSAGAGQSAPPAAASASVTFTCDDLGSNDVDLWAQDIHGNWDYVTTYVIIQDNQLACTQPLSAGISGLVESEMTEPAEEVMIYLDGDAPGMGTNYMTNGNGDFAFPQLPLNYNYTVRPEKLDELREGISTLDLVLISRHLIGAQPLDSPYKLIAADVDNDLQITAFDLISLQEVILFIKDEFPNNNTSFRFVDAAFNFADPNNPFSTPFPEEYIINGLTQPEIADFIAIKVGDVNNSAQMSSQSNAYDRSYIGKIFFKVEDKKLEIGEEHTLEFKAKSFEDLLGFQMALEVDPALQVVDWSANEIDVAFGSGLLDKGLLTTSWSGMDAVKVEDDGVLFSVTVRATEAGLLSELLSISNGERYMHTEAYMANLDHMDIELEFTNGASNLALGFELLQNQPNPFRDETEIGFVLPEASAATLTIYDVSGRIVKVVEGDFAKGYNEATVKRGELDASGVLYYQLKVKASPTKGNQLMATKKLIIMD